MKDSFKTAGSVLQKIGLSFEDVYYSQMEYTQGYKQLLHKMYFIPVIWCWDMGTHKDKKRLLAAACWGEYVGLRGRK